MNDPPDDAEINDLIASENSLIDALFQIADKYDAGVTNNEPRWQDGRYLRQTGDFIGDVLDQVRRFHPETGPLCYQQPEPSADDLTAAAASAAHRAEAALGPRRPGDPA